MNNPLKSISGDTLKTLVSFYLDRTAFYAPSMAKIWAG